MFKLAAVVVPSAAIVSVVANKTLVPNVATQATLRVVTFSVPTISVTVVSILAFSVGTQASLIAIILVPASVVILDPLANTILSIYVAIFIY